MFPVCLPRRVLSSVLHLFERVSFREIGDMRPPTEDVEDEVAEDENKIINEVRICTDHWRAACLFAQARFVGI